MGLRYRYLPPWQPLTELGVCPAGEDVHVQNCAAASDHPFLPGKQLLMTGAAETVCEGTTEV